MPTCRPDTLIKWFSPNGRNTCHQPPDSASCSPMESARIKAAPSATSGGSRCQLERMCPRRRRRPSEKPFSLSASSCRSAPAVANASMPLAKAHASRLKPPMFPSPIGGRIFSFSRHTLPAGHSRRR